MKMQNHNEECGRGDVVIEKTKDTTKDASFTHPEETEAENGIDEIEHEIDSTPTSS
jgi:hypothetical protein